MRTTKRASSQQGEQVACMKTEQFVSDGVFTFYLYLV